MLVRLPVPQWIDGPVRLSKGSNDPTYGAPRTAYLGAVGDAPGCRRGSPRWPGGAPVLAAVLAVLVLGACRADLSVTVDATAGGGGHVRAVVTLDSEAAAQVPDLARQLRVDDLEQAGWEVEGPVPVVGRPGGVTLRASKFFTSPAGATRALEELSGDGGPFSKLHLTRQVGLWKTRTALRGTVDLRAGLGAFGDPALAEKLGSPNLGLDPAAVERELGTPLAEALRVELVGRLPGTTTSNAPSSRAGAGVWPVGLGAAVAVSASSEAWNVVRLGSAGVALMAFLALLVVLVRRSRWISWK